MGSPFNPIRDQVRSEMLAALAKGAAMTTNELYSVCPSAVDARDVSRLAYELRKKGVIAAGEPVLNALGVRVSSFFMPTTTDPRIEASKPIVVERKIPKTGKSNKPRASNPYAQFTVSKPQEEAPRVTRDLPIHLQSAAPPVAAESVKPLIEEAMSQEPTPYIVNPPFALEPKAPEAQEDIDSDLVSALKGLAEFVPLPQADDDDDVLDTAAANMGKLVAAMASADVGEITQAMAKKNCHCAKIAAPPRMPIGFKYSLFSTEIHSEDDDSYMCFETGGPDSDTITLSARGDMTFDMDEISMIPEVAAFLNSLHVSE